MHHCTHESLKRADAQRSFIPLLTHQLETSIRSAKGKSPFVLSLSLSFLVIAKGFGYSAFDAKQTADNLRSVQGLRPFETNFCNSLTLKVHVIDNTPLVCTIGKCDPPFAFGFSLWKHKSGSY